jgi:SepF-like predicted cell division protein (DUF552 family)
VEHEEEHHASSQAVIEVERLENYSDSDRIQKKLREGTIMLVRIKDLKAKDMEEMKRSVERIRRTCLAINGDIAGLGEDWIVVTPSSAKVHREKQE